MFRRKVTYSRKPTHAARAAHARGERQFSKYDTSLIEPRRSKKPFYIGIAAVVFAIIVIFGLVMLFSASYTTGYLRMGDSFENKKAFSNEVSQKGYGSSLKTGIYVFNGGTPLSEVVEHLEAGPNQADNSYVIPEGYTIKQTAHAVSEAYAGSISEADFLAAAQDASRFSDRFSFVKDAYNNSLEGFLFPKTYEIMAGANADDVVAQMLTQYEQEVKQLNYTYPHDAGLSDYEVLILASIIEREAAADNKKAVASVFYNRLAIDMALQSDATTAYVIGGDPKPEDLQKEGPFNTYLNKGLPPGPICSPGLAALEAACDPDQTDYLYFYFKDNGQGGLDYFFSKTYEEHQQAIAS